MVPIHLAICCKRLAHTLMPNGPLNNTGLPMIIAEQGLCSEQQYSTNRVLPVRPSPLMIARACLLLQPNCKMQERNAEESLSLLTACQIRQDSPPRRNLLESSADRVICRYSFLNIVYYRYESDKIYITYYDIIDLYIHSLAY